MRSAVTCVLLLLVAPPAVAQTPSALGGTTVHVRHPFDGQEVRSRKPGRLCVGDATAGAAQPRPSVDADAAAPAAATIGQLEWLAGTWSGTTGTTTTEERWTPPSGGAMIAISRTMGNGNMNAFEFLCIVERNGGLVYQAMPNGRQPATEFTLTKIDGRSVTFENPEHDFPKAIRYTLAADGTLEAVVSGGETQNPIVFRFRRQ